VVAEAELLHWKALGYACHEPLFGVTNIASAALQFQRLSTDSQL